MKKVCLIILDGWGYSPVKEGNAVALAETPYIDSLMNNYPVTTIDTSGLAAGLPPGQMGNSEVGHLNMGAGRVVYQELTRISRTIEDGEFCASGAFGDLADALKANGGALHLMGLLSDGGVHSHMTHLYALIDAAKARGLKKIFIHAFLDGRDTPPSSAVNYMKDLTEFIGRAGAGVISTVSGRYYAMDRDNRWERVERAYGAMVLGDGRRANDAITAVEAAYVRGETDEFVSPTVIVGGDGAPVAPISDGDGVIFFNFRADRAREITAAVAAKGFEGFKRAKTPALAGFICMTEYDSRLNLPVLFAPEVLKNILGEVLSKNGVKQFRVSETEKYAHVTFFFNGGREAPFEGEERVLIPSAKDVATYDKKPEMSALEIAEAAVSAIRRGGYGFMLINFANGDMVGHTGVLDAAIRACETVDRAVGTVVDALKKDGWTVIITADHGNAEQMVDSADTGAYTAHTTNAVPFMLVDDALKAVALRRGGLLDIAPTVLKIMGIGKPVEMKGEPLF